jgi:BTB/POZ domain
MKKPMSPTTTASNKNNNNNSGCLVVVHDVLSAIEQCGIDRQGYTDNDPQTTSLCDVQLIGTTTTTTSTSNDVEVTSTNEYSDDTTPTRTTCTVMACRFLLAARSPVFQRMLYGNFREAQSQSIALLGYPRIILQTIVYFCSYHTLNPLFPTSIDHVPLQLQLLQAADYLQLLDLCTMITQTIVLKHMVSHPQRTVCTVYEHVPMTSPLYAMALQMIEIRPYIILDPHKTFRPQIIVVAAKNQPTRNNSPLNRRSNSNDDDDERGTCGGITILSVDKLDLLLQSKHNICASEYFLLQQLLRWYQYQKYQIQARVQLLETQTLANQDTTSTTVPRDVAEQTHEELNLLRTTTKLLCEKYFDLSHVEPCHLLQWMNQQQRLRQ